MSLAEFHRLRRLVWIILVVVLVVVAVTLIRPLALAPESGDGEPGSKRFDHFSFHNGTGADVQNVVIMLQKADGTPWGGCPPTGYPVGTIPAGGTETWVFNEDLPEGVGKAICQLEYTKPGTTQAWIQNCKVEAYEAHDVNSVTFWFGNHAGPPPPPPTADPELGGEALMTPTAGIQRNVRPHTTLSKAPKP